MNKNGIKYTVKPNNMVLHCHISFAIRTANTPTSKLMNIMKTDVLKSEIRVALVGCSLVGRCGVFPHSSS